MVRLDPIPFDQVRSITFSVKDLQGLELTIVLFSRAKQRLCTHNGCVAERHVGRSAMGQSHCLRYAHFGKEVPPVFFRHTVL